MVLYRCKLWYLVKVLPLVLVSSVGQTYYWDGSRGNGGEIGGTLLYSRELAFALCSVLLGVGFVGE